MTIDNAEMAKIKSEEIQKGTLCFSLTEAKEMRGMGNSYTNKLRINCVETNLVRVYGSI